MADPVTGVNVPRHVWATCWVEHESLKCHVPAWLEWYRVGFDMGRITQTLRRGRGVYAWVVQSAVGDDREDFLLNTWFSSPPDAIDFAVKTEWMFDIKWLRNWTKQKPGHLGLDRAAIA